jgi:hypothetical protein
MTRLEDRQILVRDNDQACADGSRLAAACSLAGVDARTLRRWRAGDGLMQGDRRPDTDRPIPLHALSQAERVRIIEIANEPHFARDTADANRHGAGGRGELRRQRVRLPSRAACARPNEPPGLGPVAADVAPTDHAHRHRPPGGLVL